MAGAFTDVGTGGRRWVMRTARETQIKAGAHGISIALLNQPVDRTLQG